MSLRAFHVFFILASVMLSIGFGIWQIQHASHTMAIASFAVGLVLAVYLFWFISKLKHLSKRHSEPEGRRISKRDPSLHSG